MSFLRGSRPALKKAPSTRTSGLSAGRCSAMRRAPWALSKGTRSSSKSNVSARAVSACSASSQKWHAGVGTTVMTTVPEDVACTRDLRTSSAARAHGRARAETDITIFGTVPWAAGIGSLKKR